MRVLGDYWGWQWLLLVERELLIFTCVFLLIGAADELAVDICWIWLRLTGRAKTRRTGLDPELAEPLQGIAAVFIPVWEEADIIAATVRHAATVWPDRELRMYIGCYPNDPRTISAVSSAIGTDCRIRLVLHERSGPTTKADCLNRLYRALEEDERRYSWKARMVVLHDAEDMVHPLALSLLDNAIGDSGLVQLPVRPEPQRSWVGDHYCEEFAESHGKAMIVRQALGAALPSAGVGCAVSRAGLTRLAERSASGEPFSAECLTEDYELGLRLDALGLRTRFLRLRDNQGRLIATRACFPATLEKAARQKARWVHGISLQGWDRLGWSGSATETWMRLRDRRGPFAALVLACGYSLFFLAAAIVMAEAIWPSGSQEQTELSTWLAVLISLNVASFVWRAASRFAFTAREYGWAEGVRAVLRIPLSNVIAIMAGWRACAAYLGTLRGQPLVWDKTEHLVHPAIGHPIRDGA